MEEDERRERRQSLQDVVESLHYRLENIERKLFTLMGIVEEITQSVENLQNDVGTKLREIHDELNKLESEKGTSPALTTARDLLNGLDTTVKGFKAAPDAPPAEKAKPTQSVYIFTGTGTPDTTVWPIAPFKTGGGTQLYYYSQDTTPGSTAGVGQPGWELYSGEAVPA